VSSAWHTPALSISRVAGGQAAELRMLSAFGFVSGRADCSTLGNMISRVVLQCITWKLEKLHGYYGIKLV